MPLAQLLGVTQATHPQHVCELNRNQGTCFVKDAFNFGNANPNRPESRDDVHGKLLYCLA